VGDVSLDREALDLYGLWWDLRDVASFVALFRRPHQENENTVASFAYLRSYLNG
jgi:spectinomycin phosphotransferase